MRKAEAQSGRRRECFQIKIKGSKNAALHPPLRSGSSAWVRLSLGLSGSVRTDPNIAKPTKARPASISEKSNISKAPILTTFKMVINTAGTPLRRTVSPFVRAKKIPVATSLCSKGDTSCSKAIGTLAATTTAPRILLAQATQRPRFVSPITTSEIAGKNDPTKNAQQATRLSILSLSRPKLPPVRKATMLMTMPNQAPSCAMSFPHSSPWSGPRTKVWHTAAEACASPADTTTM
mmetsp:Transcript_11004/g.24231  ORF Transcript_11004/g.24231 Transcript_11004/m.24231 type:complete len:235 (+) Transcript_11004:1085-1789(+)